MRQMTVHELKERLAQPGEKPVLLDVRESWELNICALPGTLHISMGQVPARTGELDPQQELVVVCHHGVRSLHVAHFLASRGFSKLCNLQGGVDSWAREIDPAMRTY
jgi:rhodanese-related sulfurtransferase